jgi:GTP:adenosylcobinamide-phosphate guanylyltransferase
VNSTLKNAVLLAAGRGSRLSSLTRDTHKSLLPVGGKPSLQHAIDELLLRHVENIVVVTGDKREFIEGFIRENYGTRINTIYNRRFAEDTNILSTEIGVAALADPGSGYLIVETDLVMDSHAWKRVLDFEDRHASFWVTSGTYNVNLTGGALHSDSEGYVQSLVYAPTYDSIYEGWEKLVGILYVGVDQVSADRKLRALAIEETISQYYMMPWVQNLPSLACRSRNLGDCFAGSYNDIEGYTQINDRFCALSGNKGLRL